MGVNASHTALPVGPDSPTPEVAEVVSDKLMRSPDKLMPVLMQFLFLKILARLRDQFYRDITPGFHARLAIIFVLNGV